MSSRGWTVLSWEHEGLPAPSMFETSASFLEVFPKPRGDQHGPGLPLRLQCALCCAALQAPWAAPGSEIAQAGLSSGGFTIFDRHYLPLPGPPPRAPPQYEGRGQAAETGDSWFLNPSPHLQPTSSHHFSPWTRVRQLLSPENLLRMKKKSPVSGVPVWQPERGQGAAAGDVRGALAVGLGARDVLSLRTCLVEPGRSPQGEIRKPLQERSLGRVKKGDISSKVLCIDHRVLLTLIVNLLTEEVRVSALIFELLHVSILGGVCLHLPFELWFTSRGCFEGASTSVAAFFLWASWTCWGSFLCFFPDGVTLAHALPEVVGVVSPPSAPVPTTGASAVTPSSTPTCT
ncbi:hypothetical protein TREES_T100021664 [Tupaia chinensis]|uniref:Uncharacterized protein n=1 Tax=Tupaia chinensis TaxID=246437 RepID=L9JQK7_TUPCH|nr:hypothetical protein TREES_T100021664 [Tupaia chinensis]